MEKAFTDQNWEDEVLNSNLPVVVDFWAEWCAPCHMMSPIIEELAKEYEGKIIIGKLNVDENQITAGKYNIMGIPTLLFFNNEELVDRIVGVVPKNAVEDKIKKMLKG